MGTETKERLDQYRQLTGITRKTISDDQILAAALARTNATIEANEAERAEVMAERANRIFHFVDIETTGLDPEACQILEVAIVTCRGPGLEIVREWSQVYAFNDWHLCDPVVVQMHAKSGLLAECNRAAHVFDALEVEQQLSGPKATLAGASVHFDRGFLRAHGVEFSACTHRHLDTSAFREACKVLGLPYPGEGAEPAHRALDDARFSREVALSYFEFLKGEE